MYPPGCGVLALALTQKFEIMESNFVPLKLKNNILLHQPCPEFLGNDFFITNKMYKVKVTKKSGASFEYIIFNNYEKENLPTYWIQEIEIINN